MSSRLLLRAEEVAEALDVGRWKVYEMMATGELPTIRIGRLVKVPRAALERWIEEHTSTGQAA